MIKIEEKSTNFNTNKYLTLSGNNDELSKIRQEVNKFLNQNNSYETDKLVMMSLLDRYEYLQLKTEYPFLYSLAKNYCSDLLKNPDNITPSLLLQLTNINKILKLFLSVFWFDFKAFLKFFENQHEIKEVKITEQRYLGNIQLFISFNFNYNGNTFPELINNNIAEGFYYLINKRCFLIKSIYNDYTRKHSKGPALANISYKILNVRTLDLKHPFDPNPKHETHIITNRFDFYNWQQHTYDDSKTMLINQNKNILNNILDVIYDYLPKNLQHSFKSLPLKEQIKTAKLILIKNLSANNIQSFILSQKLSILLTSYDMNNTTLYDLFSKTNSLKNHLKGFKPMDDKLLHELYLLFNIGSTQLE